MFADHRDGDSAFGECHGGSETDQTAANDDYFGAQLIASSETAGRDVA
jgi:hypothetical protein